MKCTETNAGEYVAELTGQVVETSIVLYRSSHVPFYYIKGTLRKSVITALEEQLSFEVKGREHMESYLSGDWNGRELLLYATKKTGMRYFPVGLLDEVIGIFEDFDVRYTVEEKEYWPTKIPLQWVSKKTLYPDQEIAVNSVLEAGGGTVCMPTGAGKTLVATAIMARLRLRTLIIVHRKELVKQWTKAIEEALGITPGIVGNGKADWKDVTVAMLQTAVRIKEIPKFDVLAADECHHLSSKTLFKLAMRCNAGVRIGLSATPKREDGAEMKIFAAVGKIVYESRPDVLVKKERIATPKFVFLETEFPRGTHRGMKFHDVYVAGITENLERNMQIVEMANKLLDEGHTVYIHVEEIAHGKWLVGHIPGAKFVSGKDGDKERTRIINNFSIGRLDILISTLLGEGVDPKISALILAGGRRTEAGTIQKIGRALRFTNDKKTAVIVDFKDRAPYLKDHWEARYASYKKYYGNYCPDL